MLKYWIKHQIANNSTLLVQIVPKWQYYPYIYILSDACNRNKYRYLDKVTRQFQSQPVLQYCNKCKS